MFKGSGYPRRRKVKLFFLPVFIVLLLALSAAVQYLWNAVLPGVVHAGMLTYWQAAGLLLLCRILFGSFHFGRRGRVGGPPFEGPGRDMRNKWASMTDEERILFKQRFRDKCRNRG